MAILSARFYSALSGFYPSTCAIQQYTATRGATGEEIKTWANVSGLGAVTCRVSPTGGNEKKQANQLYALSTHVIELDGYYASITAKMRALVGSVAYDILLPEHDGNHEMTKLVCQVVQ